MAGDFITSTVLQLLVKEKKISENIGENLKILANIIDTGAEVEDELLEEIKSYGLCKDISKYHKGN